MEQHQKLFGEGLIQNPTANLKLQQKIRKAILSKDSGMLKLMQDADIKISDVKIQRNWNQSKNTLNNVFLKHGGSTRERLAAKLAAKNNK